MNKYFLFDVATSCLPEHARRGFETIKARRSKTQIGSDYWTEEKLCQGVAKSTGKKCRRLPVYGQRFCPLHGGYSTTESRERRRGRRPSVGRATKTYAQKRLDAWASSCQREFGGARAALASLDVDKAKYAQSLLHKNWEHASYKNRKGRRAALYLIVRHIRGKIDAGELERLWGVIDPGVKASFMDRQVAGNNEILRSKPNIYNSNRTTIAPHGVRIDGCEFGGVPCRTAQANSNFEYDNGW